MLFAPVFSSAHAADRRAIQPCYWAGHAWPHLTTYGPLCALRLKPERSNRRFGFASMLSESVPSSVVHSRRTPTANLSGAAAPPAMLCRNQDWRRSEGNKISPIMSAATRATSHGQLRVDRRPELRRNAHGFVGESADSTACESCAEGLACQHVKMPPTLHCRRI